MLNMPLILKLASSLPYCTCFSKRLLPLQLHATKSSVNVPTTHHIHTDQPITRRSADFKPTVWSHDYIQSLSTNYTVESYEEQSKVLKDEVRKMLHKMEDDDYTLHQLELIDVLQRLGVAYHFDAQIKKILQNHFNHNLIAVDNNKLKGDKNMYATALEFRLLRQHGYHLSTEVFDIFQDEMGNFKSFLSEDIKGLLSLYEASFHLMEDETILEKARDFTTKHLKGYVNVLRANKDNDDEMSVSLIKHALEIPLHWRTQRLETLWFINAYERSPNMIPTLIQLAKLDFNMLQTIYQEELKHTSRWWQGIGIIGKLRFARDRLVEGFFWSQGLSFEPNHEQFRIVMTKLIAFLAIVDDIYDVYGTLEELELFTQAVERWDINSVDGLPDYMKLSFLGLFNFVNELTFDILREKDHYILSCMKKVWTDLCKAYLTEARWYYSGYTPSLQEYMENAWMSITAPLMLFHSYFLIPNQVREEDFDILSKYPNLLRLTAIIFRLADDLGTYKREMEIGDVPKSIQCYMNEHKASEAEARAHVKSMIDETLKKMNEEYYCHNSCFSPKFKDICMNVARTAIWCYQHGDGYSDQELHTNNHNISSVLFEPIPI